MSISDVWKTLFTNDFDTNKYLYHYTSFESALKIIDTNTLLFSKINNTNDPSESKIKIIFSPNENDYNESVKNINMITDCFKKYNDFVQLLCLSMDTKINKKEMAKILSVMTKKEIYYNIAGRGFALPRMWAQYGSNNKGVCFILNKEALLKLISDHFPINKCYPVVYKHFYDCYIMTSEKMKSIIKKISFNFNDSLSLLKLLEEDEEFLLYNFFEKNENWKNENEFRIMTFVDNAAEVRCRVPNFSSCLSGIVLGEQIDSTCERVFKTFIESIDLNVEVKRITFSDRLYKLI